MNKAILRRVFYSGLILGLLRVLIDTIVSWYKADLGYFLDFFIFLYLFLWLFVFRKTPLSFRRITIANLLAACLCIIVFDLYVVFKYYSGDFSSFFINRGVVALNILVISFVSGVCYSLVQDLILNKKS